MVLIESHPLLVLSLILSIEFVGIERMHRFLIVIYDNYINGSICLSMIGLVLHLASEVLSTVFPEVSELLRWPKMMGCVRACVRACVRVCVTGQYRISNS